MSLDLAPFPAKLECLFKPKRYKVLWGGRGAGRSWGVARALLLMGAGQIPGLSLAAPLRVLCAREYQNSIADSVHRVIADQIDNLGMNYIYEIQRDRILGREGSPAVGSSFSFEGIKNNVNRIKSYEGIDICWVEEAVKVSRQSWGILTPTIRKENSEIWITFNPELETDYTYVEYVLNASPEEMTVVHMTWRDNPWFPEVLRKDMERDKLRDPDRYLNVWEGHCIQALEGAVYAKELRRAQEDGRITRVPWEPEWPVETAWDLGRADATAIWFYQRIALQHRVIDYFTVSGEDVSEFIAALQTRAYNYSKHWLPHDAKHLRLGMPMSIENMIRRHYPDRVGIVPRVQKTDKYNAARLLLRKCWFDEKKCADGLTALRHYRYEVHEGQRSNEPVHDWASDGADAFAYMALAAGQSARGEVSFDERMTRPQAPASAAYGVRGAIASRLGWLGR